MDLSKLLSREVISNLIHLHEIIEPKLASVDFCGRRKMTARDEWEEEWGAAPVSSVKYHTIVELGATPNGLAQGSGAPFRALSYSLLLPFVSAKTEWARVTS